MQDKSEISYWLIQSGEDKGLAIKLLTTNTIKVPKVGEILHINTKIDKNWLDIRFKDLSETQRRALIRDEDTQISSDFSVVSVKRWLKTSLVPIKASEIFSIDVLSGSNTSGISPEIPAEIVSENFEVFLEPVIGK